MIALLWMLTWVVLVGSVLLFIASTFKLMSPRYRALLKPAAVAERRLVRAASVAAVLGSVALFVVPVYVSSSCPGSPSVTASPSPAAINSVTATASSCSEQRTTFMQVNGPMVIPLFIIPVLFALAPLALLRLRFRGPLFAVCAFLLAGPAAIGMSGYGLAFVPSSIFLMLAGFLGTFHRGANPSLPPNVPSAPALQSRG